MSTNQLQVTIQVQWLSGKGGMAGRVTPYTVTVYNIVHLKDVQLTLDDLYTVGSTHSAPGIGRFRVVAHSA